MSNVVPCVKKSSGFLTIGKAIPVPFIAEFRGLPGFPPWIHFWPETRDAFRDLGEQETGSIVVVPCACGSGWNHGWDMNLRDLLHFAQEDRSPSDSWLSLGEVLFILCSDRLGSIAGFLPSPFYFIVPGWCEELRLIEVRRTNQYGYSIDGSREVARQSSIPRQKPLFIPGRPRRSI